MTRERVVFDCNVFLQAILSQRGPSYRRREAVSGGEVTLTVSPQVLAEVRRLPDHKDLKRFKHFTVEKVDAFLTEVLKVAEVVIDVPQVFEYARDPDDAHYVNLAIRAGARLVVSRDNDLLDLMDTATPDGRNFRHRFPDLRIVRPTEFPTERETRKHLRRSAEPFRQPEPEAEPSQPEFDATRDVEREPESGD